MTLTDAQVTFERVTGAVGVIVHGVDVHHLPGEPLAADLRHALAEHGVLFFQAPNGEVSNDEFRAVGALFGDLFSYPYGRDATLPRDVGEIDFEESSLVTASRTNVWHTDGTSQATPPLAAALTPSIVPRVGGDTMWATMTGAFDALSSRYQRLLDGMEALHSTDAVARHFPPERRAAIFGDGESSVHPVVPVDPLTGRRYLYVNGNYTERLVGLTDSESERLLAMLCEHVNTPEFHVRLRWELGTIAVWHERVTQHRAVADFTERRALRRITISGDPPTA